MKRTAIFLFFFFLFTKATIGYAQSGCVITWGPGSYDNTVYTQSLGTYSSCNGYTVEDFASTPTTPKTAGCGWTNETVTTGAPLYRSCIIKSTGQCGVKATYINCDLDNWLWVLASASIFISYFYLKNSLARIDLAYKRLN